MNEKVISVIFEYNNGVKENIDLFDHQWDELISQVEMHGFDGVWEDQECGIFYNLSHIKAMYEKV